MIKARFLLTALLGVASVANGAAAHPAPPVSSRIDRDLIEVTIPKLQALYASHTYSVTQVVRWHLARIHRYNGVYRPVETLFEKQALEVAGARGLQRIGNVDAGGRQPMLEFTQPGGPEARSRQSQPRCSNARRYEARAQGSSPMPS